LKRQGFLKGRLLSKQKSWIGRGRVYLKTLLLIRRSRTWFEKKRGVKSCESQRKNLIKRKSLIKMVEYLDVKRETGKDEMYQKKKSLNRLQFKKGLIEKEEFIVCLKQHIG